MQVLRIADLGNDLLAIEGVDGSTPVAATSWTSIVTQHYPPESYDENGALLPDAQPRRMTTQELVSYAVQVLTVFGTTPSEQPPTIFQAAS